MKLETKQNSKKSDHALAAANIRRELKAAFPTIKFAIHSKSYSGGDSVDIRWELGPTSKEVEAITNKYQEGTFNGMIDLYECDNDRSWTAKYGSAKYVFAKRNCNSAQQAVETQLAKLYNAESAYDLQTSAWRILEKYSLPAGAIVTGVEHTEENSGLIQDVFRPTFTIA
jgi:Large polyvalent protein associated domain 29